MKTAPGGRREVAPGDRAWFDRVCRAQARVGCRGRPDLWDDAEAEARVYAWRAYRDGKDRGIVALEARKGAWALWRWAGRRPDTRAERLTVQGEHGEEEHPALGASPAPDARALASASARALLALLTPREAEAVLRVCAGEGHAEIAADWGVCRQKVGKLCRRAAARLRASPEAQAWLSP